MFEEEYILGWVGQRRGPRGLRSKIRISFSGWWHRKTRASYHSNLPLITGGCESIVGAFTAASIVKLFVSSGSIAWYLDNWPFDSQWYCHWGTGPAGERGKTATKNLNIIHSLSSSSSGILTSHVFHDSISRIESKSFCRLNEIIALAISNFSPNGFPTKDLLRKPASSEEAKLIKKENHDEWFGSFFALLTLSCAAATESAGFWCKTKQISRNSQKFLTKAAWITV